jgi:hypothetical protein
MFSYQNSERIINPVCKTRGKDRVWCAPSVVELCVKLLLIVFYHNGAYDQILQPTFPCGHVR